MEQTTKQHVVLVHGLFMNPLSWSNWKQYFETNGYIVHLPAYPYHEGSPVELRQNPDPKLAKLTFGQVVTSMSEFIDTLPSKPILIGHSMGGLVVQKLIEQGRGSLGVCIDTAPPQGVFSFKWSFLRANLPTINPFKGNSICKPSVKWFQYAFCNTMTLEQTKKEYEKFVVPESRAIPRSCTKAGGKIDFKKPHAPLLFIAGEKDRIIPSSLNHKNLLAYKDKTSTREFKVFKERTHYICGQDDWQEVADYIIDWITKITILK